MQTTDLIPEPKIQLNPLPILKLDRLNDFEQKSLLRKELRRWVLQNQNVLKNMQQKEVGFLVDELFGGYKNIVNREAYF
jgi:hypothetical protein